MQKIFRGILFGLLSISWQPAHADLSETAITDVFYPYTSGKVSVPGLEPGTTVSKDNWEPAKNHLPTEILDRLKAGEFSFAIQETTALPVSDAYIEATRQHAVQVKLDSDGNLDGYVSGLPFPRLDPADPQAGLKAAWNLRYRDFGDNVQVWNTFRMVPESGDSDRVIDNYYVIAYGMHRPVTDGKNPNQWVDEGILYKEFFHILSPFDLKNTLSLKHRYDSDQASDDNWYYTPMARKIRKIIVKHEDSSYDSGFLNEDFFGFWGYLHSHTWKLMGSRILLAPIGVKAVRASFGGRGNWYPAVPWELREMLILEGVPIASDHPYGKRVLYLDKQTFAPVYALFYDRDGKHHKTLFELYGDPKHNTGNEHVRAPLWTGETMIDYDNNFASITEVTKIIYNNPLPADFFDLNKMVARGR